MKQIHPEHFDRFTAAYVEAIFFTDGGEDNPEFYGLGMYDFSEKTLRQIYEDCRVFQKYNTEYLPQAGTPEQNGHDFWLTRNHHGAGFWDRGYAKPIADRLVTASQMHKPVSLTLGDDGKLYLE
jgi:hypothetical protein